MADLLKVIMAINKVLTSEKCSAREVMYLAKEMEINAMTSLLKISNMESKLKPGKK